MDGWLPCVGVEIMARCLRRGHGALDAGRTCHACGRGQSVRLPALYGITDAGGRRRKSQSRRRNRIPMTDQSSVIEAAARSQDFQAAVEMRAAKSLVASRKSNSIAPSRTREAGQSTIKLPCTPAYVSH